MKTLRQRHLSWSRAISAAFAFLCMFLGFAPCGNAAPGVPQSGPASFPQVTSQFAIADFDGDRRPDLATVQVGQGNSWDTYYWIAFQLSGGSRQTLGITAPTGGLQITSRDVNGHFREPSALPKNLGSPLRMRLRTLQPSFFRAIPRGIAQRTAGFRHPET